jgi:hypothetical protein
MIVGLVLGVIFIAMAWLQQNHYINGTSKKLKNIWMGLRMIRNDTNISSFFPVL